MLAVDVSKGLEWREQSEAEVLIALLKGGATIASAPSDMCESPSLMITWPDDGPRYGGRTVFHGTLNEGDLSGALHQALIHWMSRQGRLR